MDENLDKVVFIYMKDLSQEKQDELAELGLFEPEYDNLRTRPIIGIGHPKSKALREGKFDQLLNSLLSDLLNDLQEADSEDCSTKMCEDCEHTECDEHPKFAGDVPSNDDL